MRTEISCHQVPLQSQFLISIFDLGYLEALLLVLPFFLFPLCHAPNASHAIQCGEVTKSIVKGIGIGFLSCIGIGIGIAKTISQVLVLVLLRGHPKYWYWYC